jgi:hypothetical protein
MKIKINKEMPRRRSIPAISLWKFRSTKFHHKTEERGGATNEMAEYMNEYMDESQEFLEEPFQEYDCE